MSETIYAMTYEPIELTEEGVAFIERLKSQPKKKNSSTFSIIPERQNEHQRHNAPANETRCRSVGEVQSVSSEMPREEEGNSNADR